MLFRSLTVQPVPLPAPVARGRRATLTLEVTPNPGMHIYAAGARDVVSVTLAASRVLPKSPVSTPLSHRK